jgi:nucleoside-diphosphate-sugar epimerase
MAALDEDAPWGRTLGHYSAAKQAQERLAAQKAQERAIPLTLVRPSHVYGPHSPQWVDAVVAELKRGTPVLIGGGDFNAGLCHVDNLVEALLLCASRSEAVGRTYNVDDGSEVTWKQYFGDLARLAGAPRPKSVPRALANALAILVETPWRLLRLGGRPPLTREALNLIGSGYRFPIARIRRELGFEPPIAYEEALPAIEAGLRKSGA